MLLKEGRKRLLGEETMEGEKEVQLQPCVNKYGNGVAWFRGEMIGKGAFGSVFMATLKKPRTRYGYLPSVMAVKSAEVSVSGSLQKEREALNNVRGCPNVIRCFGEETTTGENGEMVYNLLLEYGSGGTLADTIKKSGGIGLPESEVKRYTRSILLGLCNIHDCGYVHCDLKPENILLVPNTRNGVTEFRAKIGDLGLAKRAKQSKKRKLNPYWRGTPMYLSPEAVADSIQEPPSDIWAVGCIVLEMLTGKPPWDGKRDMNAKELLSRIGKGNELPEIPSAISNEGRSFLKGCFVRKVMYRLTAEMLLNHPFVEGLIDDHDDDEVEESEEVSDVNAVSSLLLSDTDDELSCSSFSEGSFVSEEESFSSWSEEHEEEMENQEVSSFGEEETLEVEESRGSVDAGLDHVIKSSMQVSSQVRANVPQPYEITFRVPAGV